MENTKQNLCSELPHFCSAGLLAPKTAVKPEIRIKDKNRKQITSLTMSAATKQKPWSVFGDVYWI